MCQYLGEKEAPRINSVPSRQPRKSLTSQECEGGERSISFFSPRTPRQFRVDSGSPEPGSRHTVGHTQQAPHSPQLCVLGVGVTYVLSRPRCVSRGMPPWWHHQAFADVSELSFLYLKPSICSPGLQYYSLLIKGPCSISKPLQFLKKTKGSQEKLDYTIVISIYICDSDGLQSYFLYMCLEEFSKIWTTSVFLKSSRDSLDALTLSSSCSGKSCCYLSKWNTRCTRACQGQMTVFSGSQVSNINIYESHTAWLELCRGDGGPIMGCWGKK